MGVWKERKVLKGRDANPAFVYLSYAPIGAFQCFGVGFL
jgi:hypothetical protein